MRPRSRSSIPSPTWSICQALADYLTMQEAFGSLEGLTMTYVGDGNNVAHSLLIAGAAGRQRAHRCPPVSSLKKW